MARPDQRHPANVEGDWFADTRCIECDVARHYAPDLIASDDGLSVVVRQPGTPDEEQAMWRAAVACPTQSIGTISRRRPPPGVFPWLLTDGVYLCGYNDASSFGAHSYLVVRPEGNLLVDSPRFTRSLVGPITELGGLAHVLLTHRDDVADAERFAEHFGARVWIHRTERQAAPFATDLFDGARPDEITMIRPGLQAVPVPGHTAGSVAFLLEDRFLFTGDTLHWNHRRGELDVFPRQTWFSWDELARSISALAELPVEWVLAGHGRWHQVGREVYTRQMRALAADLVTVDRSAWGRRAGLAPD
jgi:glyoxylase-like metal-dependent hydrolase (beta-lactamase superfamily II)/ferredoxin